MTLALWCVLIAALLPFPFTLAAKFSKRFDNARPREYLAATTGWRGRANAVQQNAFETYPAFAAAVIVAQMLHVAAQGRIDAFAIAYLVFRLAFGACYLADLATLRSLMWFGSIGCIVGLFVISA
ncbi:MAPEG family protein [Hydrocarboniphaga sp.]|uniref:MAPEG family protein n=1 Tax=Hydrocarboniphaga sp. TaxID=2033016 RepID=UPI003D0DF2C1